MKIAFNPSTVAALIAPPNNKDITFDLRGHNIFARGVKFCGTDTNTWRDIKINNVSIDSNILDLRDGSNTTLTNTNGVVTINSTWRPVVDNLTSDSTTSSLSANQGRVLAGLINTLSTNISNQYALRDGSNATGRWRGGLACFDVRGTNYAPSDLNMGLELLFLRNNTNNLKDGGEYNGVFSFRQWASGTDWSGGKAHQLSFTDNGNIWHRTSSGDDSWGAWKKLAYSTDIPSSLKNPYSLTTFGVVYDGSAAKVVTTSTFISQVTEGTSTITDGTMLITSYASNSGFADTNAVNVPYKRKAIHLWEYVKAKTDSLYTVIGHNHDGRYVRYYTVTTLDCNNLSVGLTVAKVSATNAAHTNHSTFLYISDVGTPFQIQIPDSSVPYIYKRYYSSGTWSGWFKLNAGYADSAGSATKLQTSRLLWGQPFDGTADVSGFMQNVKGLIHGNNIGDDWSDGNNTHPWYGIDYRHCVDSTETGKAYTSISSYFGLYFKTGGSRFIFDGGNVGIGTASPIEKLDVHGNIISNNIRIYGNEVTNNSKGLFIQASDKTNRAFLTYNGNVENTSYLNICSTFGNIVLSPYRNVGIGTITPAYKLDVIGSQRIYSTYPQLRIENSSGGTAETSIYISNGTAGWAIGINPWGVGSGVFGIGQYSGSGSSTWRFKIDNSGYCYTQSYLNLGAGNEKNLSSPPYVWGVNGSDNYLRTYATSALRVAYANSAGSASNLTVSQYLSNTDTTWYPLIWGGNDHRNTYTSTGGIYKSQDVLSWQTSSQTLHATNLYTGRLETINNHYYHFNSDATLRIYGSPNDNTERIYFQAGIDNRMDDYDIPSYGGEQRHSIILNPRGGFVGIGDTNPSYKLSVGGDIGTGGNIYISHSTNNNMNYDTSNPRIVFSEYGSQAVGLVYTDYDSYRLSKGLKVMDVNNDDTGNVWFEVQGYNYSSGYVKNGSNDNYVLLGGGGHKLESALSVANADKVDGYHYNDFTYKKYIGYNRNGPYNMKIFSKDISSLTWGASHLIFDIFSSGYNSNRVYFGKYEVSLGHWNNTDKNPTVYSRWIFKTNSAYDCVHVIKDLSNYTVDVYIENNLWDCSMGLSIIAIDGFNMVSSNSWVNLPSASDTVQLIDTTYLSFMGNADMLDGYHASELFTALSNSNNGISITVGGTTKSVSNISVNYANSAGRADYLSGHGVNPDNSHPGHGARVFYSWDTGCAGNSSSGYSNGITIGSHPSDTNYGFQIVQNMWDDRTYTRRYNGGWQSWKTLAWTSDIPTVTDYYWANVKVSASSNTQTQPSVNTIYANNWFRSQGDSGWYSESYGGGIWMNDSNWIRTYGGKSFYCDNQIYSSNSIRMSDILLEHTNEINSNSGIYLNFRNSGNINLCQGGGNVGIGTTAPSYKLDVNGDIWCRGALRVGSSATNNYIAFYGNTGDAPGSFVTSFIGEHLWGGDESTELLLMKFNDVGNGIDGITPYSSGPDRIRHIAHAHVFQIMTDSSQGDFATMAATTAVETKLDITRNRITASVPLYLQSDLHVNGALQFHVPEAHIGHDGGYSDPWGGLDANFKFGGVLAATHIYSNGGFHKYGGNENQLLRADGGVAAFNWAGQSGQPTWLWGGNDFNSYYVYNPSNFRVAYASSAGNAETLGGMPKNYGQAPFNTIPCVSGDGVMEIGRYIDYHYDNSGNYDFSTRLQASGNNRNVVTLPSESGTLALTSYGGDYNHPIFLGYLNLDHGDDGTVSSYFYCLGYSVPFTYTRGGNYCKISIPDTSHQAFYIKAAIASVNYSGGGMDTWVGDRRNAGAWWLHCYASDWNEVRVKGFCQRNSNNDSWWGGNPLWSDNSGANKITVCIFGYVTFK